MQSYAVVEIATGHVVNVALWDGQNNWKSEVEKSGIYQVRPATATDVIWQPPSP